MDINNILTIMKKEFFRVFKDKRLLFTSIIMPGLLIYVMYTFMGNAMLEANTTASDYRFIVYEDNMPGDLKAIFNNMGLAVRDGYDSDKIYFKQLVAEKNADLFLVFPENFGNALKNYGNAQEEEPNVEIYYNSSKTESYDAYFLAENILNAYETSIVNVFDINRNASEGNPYDLASDEDSYRQILSMLMPMLLMVFMFSACMQVAPESIAGEKERGTIATILVTPVKRSELALGKVMALGCISLISGLSSFLGIIFSLPNLIGENSGDIAALFSAKDYIFLLMVMLSTVLVIVALMSVLSAFAKTIKEATAYLTPLMLVIIGVSLSGLLLQGSGDVGMVKFLVPILNSSQCFTAFFSFQYSVGEIVATVCSNLVFSGIVTWILSRMFHSEKIIFAK